MRHVALAAALAAPFALAAGAAFPAAAGLDGGMIPLDHLYLTEGPARGVVFLISEAGGWDRAESAVALRLRAAGSAVVGIDLPEYLHAIAAGAAENGGCAYLVSDIESLSQQIQRQSGVAGFTLPVVAGLGLGGGLALDIVDQTPDATIGATVAVNPPAAVPLDQPLCTDAAYLPTAHGPVYDLPAGPLPDPVSLLDDGRLCPRAHERLERFRRLAARVSLVEGEEATADRAAHLIEARVVEGLAAAGQMPVIALPAKPAHDAMAIILSGDGGWRDLDMSVGAALQADGVPVVGVDSLHYFWTAKTPEQTAQDLARLIDTYSAQWGVNNVLLAGYSFGADVLPATYLALPAEARAKVRLVSLMGFERSGDWQITVEGWLGSHSGAAVPTLPALERMPPHLVQCIFGAEEDDTGCTDPAPQMARVKLDGGHHFDGDYGALEKRVLAALVHRSETLTAGDLPLTTAAHASP